MSKRLLALLLFALPLAAQTPVRIAAGESAPYTDSAANIWSADADFNGGSVFSTTHAIAGTKDSTLFQNERWSATPLTYTIPVPAGNWFVSLYFSENYVTGPQQRLFNVSINGTQVLTQFDIFATAGAQYTENIEAFPVTSTGTVTITFSPGTIQNPKIDAIQLLPVQAVVTTNLTVNLNLSNEDGTIPTIYSVAVSDITQATPVTELTLVPNTTTGLASGQFAVVSTDTYQPMLSVSGMGVPLTPWQGVAVQTLMPKLSQLNLTIVLCKTTCTAGAIKSFSQSAQ